MKRFKAMLEESTSEKFKDLKSWKNAAEKRQFKVVMPPRLKNGDTNDKKWFLAKGEKGNTVGEFNDEKGFLYK